MDFEKLKKECEINTFRAPGPGGQHKNVTDSAVRLKHRPTGIVVIGRRHRSQHRNMADALSRLAEKIEESRRVRRKRKPTRKPKAVREKELDKKRREGLRKSLRRRISPP